MLLKRPVSYQEVSVAITKARMSGMNLSVAWFLRILSIQFFRPTEKLGEMADLELSTLFAEDFNEEPLEIETVGGPTEDGGHTFSMRDIIIGPVHEDRTPPCVRNEDVRQWESVNCPDDKDIIQQPQAVTCQA